MNAEQPHDTEDLLSNADAGDWAIVEELFSRYRCRLRQMLTARMDHRMSSRVDASDVIQETLIEAHRRLPAYLDQRPLPFYPWLRQMALNRLMDLHRRHILVEKRSVRFEEHRVVGMADPSTENLACHLVSMESSPSHALRNKEIRERVQVALGHLSEPLREVLIMRHLERLPVREIAAIQNVAEGTVKSRHFRALEFVRRFLEQQP